MSTTTYHRTHRDLGPLHRLLLIACPADDAGAKSIPLLASALAISPQAVFKWCHLGRLPAKRAEQVVKLAMGRVTRADLERYVYGL